MAEPEKLEFFRRAATDAGCYLSDCLELRIDGINGIGIFLNRDVETTDPLIKVPIEFLITKKNALEYFKLSKCLNPNPNAITQLFLSHLRAKKCGKWASYVAILPSISEFGSPLVWSTSDRELLRGSDLYLKIKRTMASILDEWYELLRELNLNDNTVDHYYHTQDRNNIVITDFDTENSFGSYIWASLIFRSRAFPSIIFDSSANIEEAFLYPVVDLLNHKNGTKVSWKSDNGCITFTSFEKLHKDSQIFNNYGDKNNEELLMNYGFVENPNQFDITNLTLKLPLQIIQNSLRYGVKIDRRNLVDDAVISTLSFVDILPKDLIDLFSFICKLSSEDTLTVRSTMEGLDKLNEIILQKVAFFKEKLNETKLKSASCRNRNYTNAKSYFTAQKVLFQSCSDQIQKVQKSALKTYKPISFKTILKMDKLFSDTLLLSLGVTSYEDLLKKSLMQQALLLWIVKLRNSALYKGKVDIPSYILETFNDVQDSIVIEKSDVLEYMDFYKAFFPVLPQKIPEVFGVGSWSIRDFIVAGTVIDRLVWKRSVTGEPFFFQKQEYHHLNEK